MKAKNRLKVMGAPDPRLVCSRRSTGLLQGLPHTHRVPSLTGRITREALHTACKAVKRHRGAAGLDTQSIKRFAANLEANLVALRRELKSGA